MRALAMTGMETAEMMPWIMSGSLIRDTPPCARMSAGTRSSAMTATAPASSAILACSGVTTSMMTPPLSISAMPRLTRVVPVLVPACRSAAAAPPGVWVVLTMSCLRCVGGGPWEVTSPSTPRVGPAAGCSGPGPGGGTSLADERGDVVVELDGVRHRGVPGQVEDADRPRAPHPAHVGDGVVVEAAGQLHAGARRGDASDDVAPDGVLGQHRDVEGLGEVALGLLALLPVLRRSLERVRGRVGHDEGGGAVEQPAVGELDGGLGPTHEAGVERGERAAEAHVEPVEAGRRVRQVPGDDDEDEQDGEDPRQQLAHRVLPPGRNRLQRAGGSNRAAARPS